MRSYPFPELIKIQLEPIKVTIPPHKHLYKVTYIINGNNYCKYYYSDNTTLKDFMKHNNDGDSITNVEYVGKVYPDD